MKVYENIRVYGDLDSAVHVAPTGTTLPTDLGDLDPAFVDVGWLGEDGITFERNEEAQTFRAHQGGTIVRRKKTSVEDSFTFQCLEETAVTMGLRYAGQAPTVTGSGAARVAKITVKDQTKSDPRAFVVDEVDGDVITRYVIPVGYVGSGSLAYSNSQMTVYEFTVTIQGEYDIITNSPGVIGEE